MGAAIWPDEETGKIFQSQLQPKDREVRAHHERRNENDPACVNGIWVRAARKERYPIVPRNHGRKEETA